MISSNDPTVVNFLVRQVRQRYFNFIQEHGEHDPRAQILGQRSSRQAQALWNRLPRKVGPVHPIYQTDYAQMGLKAIRMFRQSTPVQVIVPTAPDAPATPFPTFTFELIINPLLKMQSWPWRYDHAAEAKAQQEVDQMSREELLDYLQPKNGSSAVLAAKHADPELKQSSK